MKVYLTWNDGDYYGPYPMNNNFVYASLEAAKRAIESYEHLHGKNQWKLVENEWMLNSYRIEEVEVSE